MKLIKKTIFPNTNTPINGKNNSRSKPKSETLDSLFLSIIFLYVKKNDLPMKKKKK